MPFTFLAHQAPVLPLKMWRPEWFSGSALVIGSMAPDFDKFFFGRSASRFGHTLPGQLLFCLPLTVVVYLLLRYVAAAPFARYAPDLGLYRIRDYARALAAPRKERPITFAGSALIGSFTHVLWDGVTHGDPRVVALVPALAARAVLIAGHPVSLLAIHQVLASALGGLFTGWLMLRLARGRTPLRWARLDPASPPATGRARDAAAYWLVVVATMAIVTVVALLLALPPSGHWRSTRAFLLALGFRLPLAGFVGVCVAGLVARRWGTPPAPTAAPIDRSLNRPRTRPTTSSRAR